MRFNILSLLGPIAVGVIAGMGDSYEISGMWLGAALVATYLIGRYDKIDVFEMEGR